MGLKLLQILQEVYIIGFCIMISETVKMRKKSLGTIWHDTVDNIGTRWRHNYLVGVVFKKREMRS